MIPVVAEVVRSGFVEGQHHGTVVALAADETRELVIGDVDTAMLPRSCSKPIQALAMVRAGLDLDGELLALASSSPTTIMGCCFVNVLMASANALTC